MWTHVFETIRDVLNLELFRLGDTPVMVSTILIVVAIFIATIVTSKLLRRAITRALTKRVGNDGTIVGINGLVHYVVLAVGISIGLQTMGLDLTALFAAGAVFAVGIGFAMKNIAENFVSGVILLIERTIRPNDVIDVDGRFVKVIRMGIRATLVQSRDGEDIIMPNSILVQSAVKNYTLQEPVFRSRVPVGVVYSSDMKLVHETLVEASRTAMREIPELVDDREPEIIMVGFGNSSVDFQVAVWHRDPWRVMVVRSQIAQRIWWALQAKNIVIAFPQVDVHFDPPVARGFEALAGKAA